MITEHTITCNCIRVDKDGRKLKITLEDADIKEFIESSEVQKFIRKEYTPGDFHNAKEIEEWAEEHGYTKN